MRFVIPKYKIMKLIKLTILLLLFLALSCKEKKTTILKNDDIALVEIAEEEETLVRKNFYDTYTFSNWNDFNLANVRLHQIESEDYNTTVSRLVELDSFVVDMPKSIPNWLKTDKVLNELDDVQKKYKELKEERDTSTTVVRKNYKELTKEFNDLREELGKIVEENITE